MSWKLGRVAGIDLFLHPTFLLVLLFPGVMAGGMPTILLVLAVFGCVLLHELGHALMARRFGIGTVDITLYPIGGVARLERMPRAPGAELLIAIAGPAVNFAIVGTLMAMNASGLIFLDTASGLGPYLASLMEVNLILGLFNLIPAFPMDGGRILRAALSGLVGRAKATSIAARIGQALALVFGVVSLLMLNFVQVFLAAFIYLMAGREEAGVLAEERRRSYMGDPKGGIWTAPPGYRWVDRGDGAWQLAPIVVHVNPSGRASGMWN